ncbi:hypothetical protein Tco_1313131 [Tanacetum coccineum]
MIAFLEKPAESKGFQEIIDFLNANQIHYALTVNPTIYTSCIERFWATAKAKMINGERQLQALVDKNKVIIMETSIRSDLHLDDAGGIDCLPTATIFEELARMRYEKPSQKLTFYKAFFSPQWKFLIHTVTQCLSAKTTAWNEFSSTMASAIICLATNQKFNLSKYIFDAMEIFANMKREGKDFSGRVTPLFTTMMVQANQEEGVDSGIPTDSQQTPITTQLSFSRPQKKQSRRKQRKETEVPQDETHHDDSVLDLEKAKDAQAKEIDSLKKREDASKQGRIFEDIDKDAEVSLVDETQGRSDDAEMFDTDDLHGDEVIVDMAVGVTTAIDEITLAQTLIEIKEAKPKVVTTAATTTTTTRPKARGVTKDKGKAIMIEPEVPLKKKDQVALDEEMARNLEAQLLLAGRLQTREQEELTDEEKAKLFMEFMEKRRKYFVALRAQEKRNRPPTKTQKRNQMSIYLKHMGGYKHNQLKGRSYDEIQKLFDKEMKRTKIAQDSSAKRAGDKLKYDKSKTQKTDENKEVEVDNEAELKKHMVTVKDDHIAIDAIPLATKPRVIVKYKLIREGIIGHYQLIRVDGSSKRYSSMIRMLQGIDREDLETLWKLVKTKHGDTRPEDEHERVLWGDLKVMFEPDIKSYVWRNLQGYTVTVWKLFDSCGVHFVRFGNVHIFMLVEKRYPLTPITIINMLNKKLQADYWNEMCYQLLKLMVKQQQGIDQGLGSTSGIRAFALRNFDLEVMEFESAHSNTTAKLPILKLGEYEMWVIRIKQYFQVQDYALWEVIENGNSWVSVPQTA